MQLETDYFKQYLTDLPELGLHEVAIQSLAEQLFQPEMQPIQCVSRAFNFVNQQIAHSWDIQAHEVAKTACDVLKFGHGICYAKAYLLAALLRLAKIPTGFCYQRLCLFDDGPRQYCVHALNAIYWAPAQRWLRIDARGGELNQQRQFLPPQDILAFQPKLQCGECDYPLIYATPNSETVRVLQQATDALNMYRFELPQQLSV